MNLYYITKNKVKFKRSNRYNKGMRTAREMQLLKARQMIYDALGQILEESVIRMRLYKKMLIKLYICEELLTEERKRKLKVS